MPVNLIILVAAVIVAFLIFKALLNLLKTFLSTAITIFIIVVILNILGFTLQDLMHEIVNLPQIIKHLSSGNK
ncbi:hypothetical protein [Nostoc sp.]|uniref:hypothetical protein n=1 Tax=Nostoc sp. TaxID=1180 RepID=UPI002FFA358E